MTSPPRQQQLCSRRGRFAVLLALAATSFLVSFVMPARVDDQTPVLASLAFTCSIAFVAGATRNVPPLMIGLAVAAGIQAAMPSHHWAGVQPLLAGILRVFAASLEHGTGWGVP